MPRGTYTRHMPKQNRVKKMARKETIYTVSKENNQIARASKTFLSAIKLAATMPAESYYLATSEFQDLKKGDTMSNIVDFL